MAENQNLTVKSVRTKIVLITLIAGLLITGLSALGIWQVKRLSWKHDLIARVEQNINASPVSAPDMNVWQNADKKAFEYRAVTLSGHYLNDKEIAVGALTERGSGYWIVTPFQRDNGEIVFINRGYVANAKRDPLNRTSGQIDGETTVTGLLRLTEPKGFFLRQNEPEKNIWYARDIEAFAKHVDVKNVPDYFIDANAEQNRADRPEGGLTVIKFADNHLVYALTWFSLALMVLGMAVFLIRYENKRIPEDDE
ncbi:MAG: SURF1 family protein [Brucellaceae bacterium]|jgi:surfeit locus 1 family protein|nr:SURF1 family protein [Brucellaceae bacterium]